MQRTVPIVAAIYMIICACSCTSSNLLYVLRKDGHRLTDSSRRNEVIQLIYEDLSAADYECTVGRMYPTLHKKKKLIVVSALTENNSPDTLRFISSRSLICSPADTFTAQHGRYYIAWPVPYNTGIHEEIRDTIILAPHSRRQFTMVFGGNKNYSRRLFKSTNASDTLRFRVNLFGKRDTTILLRNYKS
jgi:hypothetical protein